MILHVSKGAIERHRLVVVGPPLYYKISGVEFRTEDRIAGLYFDGFNHCLLQEHTG
jgi:hypothetical protein